MASTCINLNISLVIAVLVLVPMQLHQFFGLYFNKAQTVLADSDGDAFTWTPIVWIGAECFLVDYNAQGYKCFENN